MFGGFKALASGDDLGMSDASARKQVRVVHRDALDGDTPQTPGLVRDVAFDARNPDAAVVAVRPLEDASTISGGASSSRRPTWGSFPYQGCNAASQHCLTLGLAGQSLKASRVDR